MTSPRTALGLEADTAPLLRLREALEEARTALNVVAEFMRIDVQSGDSDLWTPEYEEMHDQVIAARKHAVNVLAALPTLKSAEADKTAVKFLDWIEDDDNGRPLYRARTDVGPVYTIYDDGFSTPPFRLQIHQLHLGSFINVGTAQGAAQADFEQRIRSALVSTPPTQKQDQAGTADLTALRNRLSSNITLLSKDKHMLLALVDAALSASSPPASTSSPVGGNVWAVAQSIVSGWIEDCEGEVQFDFFQSEMLQTRIATALSQSSTTPPAATDSAGVSGRLPERETFWLIERVGHGQWIEDHSTGTYFNLTNDVWHARRFDTERAAHERWRSLNADVRKNYKPIEHIFIHGELAAHPARGPDREAIARIIDPNAFNNESYRHLYPDQATIDGFTAFQKADAIIALNAEAK